MSFSSKPRAQKHMKKLSPLVIPEPMISLSFTNGFADKLRSAVVTNSPSGFTDKLHSAVVTNSPSGFTDKLHSAVVTNSPSSFADKLREAVTMARHETQRMDEMQTDLHKFVDE